MTNTSKKQREFWISDAPNSVTWESLVGTKNYWGDRGICFVKKEDYQSLLERCEKLEKALEFIAKDETPELSDSTNYVSVLQIARQAISEFKKFKGEL